MRTSAVFGHCVQVTAELDMAKKARLAWREELNALEAKLAEAVRVFELRSAEQDTRSHALGSTFEGFKREVRSAIEASNASHSRTRELLEERAALRSDTGVLGSTSSAAADSMAGSGSYLRIRTKDLGPSTSETFGCISSSWKWPSTECGTATMSVASTPPRSFQLSSFGVAFDGVSPTSARLSLPSTTVKTPAGQTRPRTTPRRPSPP